MLKMATLSLSSCVAVFLSISRPSKAFNYTSSRGDIQDEKPTTVQGLIKHANLIAYLVPSICVVLLLFAVIFVTYRARQRRRSLRLQSSDGPTMDISVPDGHVQSVIMRNIAVDIVPVTVLQENGTSMGRPQLKSKMLQSFSEAENRHQAAFVASQSLGCNHDNGINDDYINCIANVNQPVEYPHSNGLGANDDYINCFAANMQDAATSASNLGFSGSKVKPANNQMRCTSQSTTSGAQDFPSMASRDVANQTEQRRERNVFLPKKQSAASKYCTEQAIYENQTRALLNTRDKQHSKAFKRGHVSGARKTDSADPPTYINVSEKKIDELRRINQSKSQSREKTINYSMKATDNKGSYENLPSAFSGESKSLPPKMAFKSSARDTHVTQRARFFSRENVTSEEPEYCNFTTAPKKGQCRSKTVSAVPALPPKAHRPLSKSQGQRKPQWENLMKLRANPQNKNLSEISENPQTNTANLLNMMGLELELRNTKQRARYEDEEDSVSNYDDNLA